MLLPSNLRDTTDLSQVTQEVRLASEGDGRFQWLVGAFFSNVDRKYAQRLPTPGYDAEAVYCHKGGKILFTSVRDGDLELYEMNENGGDVKRLTNAAGYDGGAFYNADCTEIVWRAYHYDAGTKELADYKALLAHGLVKPTKMELFVMNADGSNQRQITTKEYLEAYHEQVHPFKNRKRSAE